MQAFQIENIRSFMKQLLLQDTFDTFLVSEVSVTTFASFRIDGSLHPEFYSQEEEQALRQTGRTHALWQELRPFCLSVIRGQRQPLSLQIVLQLPPEKSRELVLKHAPFLDPADVFGLFFNIRYRGDVLTVTTGTSVRSFSPDRSLDTAWDGFVRKLLEDQDLL